MSRRRVFVTGIGAITPLGATWVESVAPLAQGRSAVAPVDAGQAGGFDVSGFPCTVAARIPRAFAHGDDRRLALAREAAREAWAMGGSADVAPARVGVFIGAESGRATIPTILALARAAGGGNSFDHQAFGREARALAARMAAAIGAQGPVQTISIACASGAAAIVEATRAIRLGVCDLALCGGVGADVDPLMLVGFGKLAALSARGLSCPFDLRRDGFVVGEGAAMVVLSCAPANVSGAGGPIEITGVGRTLDAYHLTKPDPRGDGAARAMQAALADAGRDTVDYIQAHGTSTPLNDEAEARAIRRVFGDRTAAIPVSSVKGALGHWVAGAGAIGFSCAVEALRTGTILPTAGLQQPDPACDLCHVQGSAARRPVAAAMVNSFAFGGANACIVVERVP